MGSHERKPSVDVDRRTPAIILPDGTYIQIHTWEGADAGSLYIWANNTHNTNYGEIIKYALSFGYSIGMRHIDFEYLEDEESLFDGFEVHDKRGSGEFEQIYYIN